MTGRIKQRNKDIAIYTTPYKFSGKELDEETGLYYYGARYMHPKYGMWLSTDPLEGKYPNVSSYTYCHNNPIIIIDPYGLTDFLNEETLEHTYVNDNINRVLQVSAQDYKLLVDYNFDSNSDIYSEVVGRGIERKDLFFTIENVLCGKTFQSWNGNGNNCFRAAVKQNNNQLQDPSTRIDVLYQGYIEGDFINATEYLKDQLVKGKSVVTGVKTNKNHGNHNPLTGHFINIVGMGFDDFGNYFSYYDNATSDRNIGTNLMENRFYFGNLNKNARVMYDDTNIVTGNVKRYFITEIRRNK